MKEHGDLESAVQDVGCGLEGGQSDSRACTSIIAC